MGAGAGRGRGEARGGAGAGLGRGWGGAGLGWGGARHLKPRPPPLSRSAHYPAPQPAGLSSHSSPALTFAIIFRRVMLKSGDSLSQLMTPPCPSSRDSGYLWLWGHICHLGPVRRHLSTRAPECVLGPAPSSDAGLISSRGGRSGGPCLQYLPASLLMPRASDELQWLRGTLRTSQGACFLPASLPFRFQTNKKQQPDPSWLHLPTWGQSKN